MMYTSLKFESEEAARSQVWSLQNDSDGDQGSKPVAMADGSM